MQNQPRYAVGSVDRALQLAKILQVEGAVRLTDAARRLGVSDSTAHRLLAMLVYHGFAEQQPDRRYRAGPALNSSPGVAAPVGILRQVALPHLRNLNATVDESTNVFARAGLEMRFVLTVESSRALRVGYQSGNSIPLHQASGGRAILASMRPDEVKELYRLTEVDPVKLNRSLKTSRRNGYGVNDQLSDSDVVAIGVALWTQTGKPTAAISVDMPSSRATTVDLSGIVTELVAVAAALQVDLDQRFGIAWPYH